MLRINGTSAAWLATAAVLVALGPIASRACAQQGAGYGYGASPAAQANLANGYWSMYGAASQPAYAAAQAYYTPSYYYGASAGGDRPSASAAAGAFGSYDAPRQPSPAEIAGHYSHSAAPGQSARRGDSYVSCFGSDGQWVDAGSAITPQYFYYYDAAYGTPQTALAHYEAGASPQYFDPSAAPAYYYYAVPQTASHAIHEYSQATPRPASYDAFALLQDPIEDPPAETIVPLLPAPGAPDAGEGTAAADEAAGAAADGQQTFGEEPQSDVLEFLRAQTVLLAPGERQIEIGLEYGIAEGFVLLPQIVAGNQVISSVRARQRLLVAPIEVRYGLCEKVQAFYNIPFGWNNTEVSFPGFDEFSNKGGMGDINAGLSILLHEGGGYGPDIVATLAFTAPTGVSDLAIVGIIPPARMGEGFWAGSAQLLFIQTYDPVVIFYGLGYRHRFDADFVDGTVEVDPGEQIIYQMGVGFAANETVTLSTSFLGLYVTEDYVNDVRVQGGILEPMQLRFAATIAKPCTIHEPFAAIGMTNDAFSARIGMSITF